MLHCLSDLDSSHSVTEYVICRISFMSEIVWVCFVAQTPIEEFTPTPAFPALQYLESVDEGGVAWRAGLRMGDFLIEVSSQQHHGLEHGFIFRFQTHGYVVTDTPVLPSLR